MEKDPEMFKLVMKFEQHIWDDGALSRKTKKLIAIAIAAALRDQHAVYAQMGGAAEAGRHKRGDRRSAQGCLPAFGHAGICIWQSPDG